MNPMHHVFCHWIIHESNTKQSHVLRHACVLPFAIKIYIWLIFVHNFFFFVFNKFLSSFTEISVFYHENDCYHGHFSNNIWSLIVSTLCFEMSRPRLKACDTSVSSMSTDVGLSSPGGKLLALARRWGRCTKSVNTIGLFGAQLTGSIRTWRLGTINGDWK